MEGRGIRTVIYATRIEDNSRRRRMGSGFPQTQRRISAFHPRDTRKRELNYELCKLRFSHCRARKTHMHYYAHSGGGGMIGMLFIDRKRVFAPFTRYLLQHSICLQEGRCCMPLYLSLKYGDTSYLNKSLRFVS